MTLNLKPTVVRRMARDYASGVPLRELADRYSISYTTVRLRLIAAGVELRRPGRRSIWIPDRNA